MAFEVSAKYLALPESEFQPVEAEEAPDTVEGSQQAALRHEMRHVCDVYAQMPMPVLAASQRDRIVKIACVFGIDHSSDWVYG